MRLILLYGVQITGLLIVLCAGVIRNKKMILFLIFLANCCSTATMFLVGRYDGGAATVVCTVRAFLFLFRDRVKGNQLCWICVAAHGLVGLMAWQSPISILVIAAPVVLTLTQWFGSVNVLKLGTMFSDLCWAIFDLSNGVYIEGMRDLAEAGSNIIGLARGRHNIQT